MKTVFQLAHIILIVATAALYAWLVATLPADDPWKVRISASVAIAAAVWAALLFVETLRAKDECGFKERCLGAYRRLLNRTVTLLGSTVVLAAVDVGLIVLGAGYNQVEFASQADQDVSVFISNPGEKAERVAIVPAGKQITTRLPVGRQWIYFETTKGIPVPYRTARLDVPPIWHGTDHLILQVPETLKYEGN